MVVSAFRTYFLQISRYCQSYVGEKKEHTWDRESKTSGPRLRSWVPGRSEAIFLDLCAEEMSR